MKGLIRENQEQGVLELLIDTRIFSKDIVIDTAYSFVDRGYFFFYYESDTDLIVQYRPKKGKQLDEFILLDFYDSLLEFSLREKLERENKVIREIIVKKAIEGPLDLENFVSFDTSSNTQENNQNFDSDIDAILKEMGDIPELDISEAEIDNILEQIDKEYHGDIEKPQLNVNLEALKKSKQDFQKKKK